MASTETPGSSEQGQQSQQSQGFAQRAKEEVSSARREMRHAKEGIRNEAKGIASAVRSKVTDTMEDGKSGLTDSLDDFAAAMRKACDELEEREQRSAASVVRYAADGMEQATQAVRDRSVQDIAGSISSFARERPAAFIIGALIAGVALGRLARASTPEQNADGYGESGDYGDPYDY